MRIFALATLAVAALCLAQPTTSPSTQPLASPLKAYYDQREKLKQRTITELESEIAEVNKEVQLLRGQRGDYAVGQRRRFNDHISTVKKRLDTLKNNKDSYPVLTIETPDMKVGAAGRFGSLRTIQIVGPTEMIVQATTEQTFINKHVTGLPVRTGVPKKWVVWLIGRPTEGLIDDEVIESDFPVFISGTKQYETADGTTNTVFLAEPIILPADLPE